MAIHAPRSAGQPHLITATLSAIRADPRVSPRPSHYASPHESNEDPATSSLKITPGIGPVAFTRQSEFVIRQLQMGRPVTVEVPYRARRDRRSEFGPKVWRRLAMLAEGVGVVESFESGANGRTMMVLVPGPPPSPDTSARVPATPTMPIAPTSAKVSAKATIN
jgi:hypothetical protein